MIAGEMLGVCDFGFEAGDSDDLKGRDRLCKNLDFGNMDFWKGLEISYAIKHILKQGVEDKRWYFRVDFYFGGERVKTRGGRFWWYWDVKDRHDEYSEWSIGTYKLLETSRDGYEPSEPSKTSRSARVSSKTPRSRELEPLEILYNYSSIHTKYQNRCLKTICSALQQLYNWIM